MKSTFAKIDHAVLSEVLIVSCVKTIYGGIIITKFARKKKNSDPNLSRVAEMVEKVLKNSDTPLKSEDIVIKTGLSLRSVRYGMKILMESEKITKYPDLRDLRSFYYKFAIK